ncbi:MAG: hypothetical protein ACXACU_12790, partial [Candidatus Hodarchaeales archaeon]
MKVDENFAIFVSQSTIEWYFGNPDAEFLTFITNFLTGLGNIASEIFEGENSVASIEFDRQQHSGFKSSEIFVVSLSNQFFFVCSDPSVTMKLIASTEGLPHIMEEQISAVLVGQASVLFAQSISEAKSENDRIKISKHFQNIILDFSPRLINDINVIVSQSSSNFSMLSFQELLMLHYAIRKDTFLTDQRDPEGWVLVSNLSGGELPFSWNVESDVVLAGYLAVIIGFIETLFSGSRPKSLVFGTNVVQRLDFIIGSKYFLAFDSPFSVLCKDSDFIPSFNAISHNVIDDLSLSLKEMIIQETLGYATSIIDIIDFKTLLDSYQVFSKEIYLSRNEKEL